MVVLIQSQLCQCRSEDCISVRRKEQCVTTTGHYCNTGEHFLLFSNPQITVYSEFKIQPSIDFCLRKAIIFFQRALQLHVGWLVCKIGLIWNIMPTHLSHQLKLLLTTEKHNGGVVSFLKQKPAHHSLCFLSTQTEVLELQAYNKLFLVQGGRTGAVSLPLEKSGKKAPGFFSLQKCWSVTLFLTFPRKVSESCHLLVGTSSKVSVYLYLYFVTLKELEWEVSVFVTVYSL